MPYTEKPLVKTKIIATVGPATREPAKLRELVLAGVDVFRLNFAHGEHAELAEIVRTVRALAAEIGRPIGILGDLAGPKIRLGELPEEGLFCGLGEQFQFVPEADPDDPAKLTTTYDRLAEDLRNGDRVLLADGTVGMRVIGRNVEERRVICVVENPGLIRSRQGVNLPGASLSLPSLTAKDKEDLTWAIANGLDFVGLSFVRSADDLRLLRREIDERIGGAKGDPAKGDARPHVVAKIEKMEAVGELDAILDLTDAVMVARGDLGVEVDIARVPAMQKQIIRLCNQHRIPVITATQMLDSMQENDRPTRAEASDVANAVLDGSDAVMLSGETAIGKHPVAAVAMMSRIAQEAERMVTPNRSADSESLPSSRASIVTEAVTLGAGAAAEHLGADLIVIATHSGKTAMALSKQRGKVPIIALTDLESSARRMCLYWGVIPQFTDVVSHPPHEVLKYVIDWGRKTGSLDRGGRVVMVTSSDWSRSHEGKDLMLVHAIP
jgi:pyruvate kinase